MTLIIIIIFLLSIISLFGMLMFRAWEVKKDGQEYHPPVRKVVPEIYFRHVEKIMLYLAKHVIQWIVLMVVKYWFIFYAKAKKWSAKKIPKICEFFRKKTKDINPQRNSFIRKAVIESKTKIKHIKEKVRREHGEK